MASASNCGTTTRAAATDDSLPSVLSPRSVPVAMPTRLLSVTCFMSSSDCTQHRQAPTTQGQPTSQASCPTRHTASRI